MFYAIAAALVVLLLLGVLAIAACIRSGQIMGPRK